MSYLHPKKVWSKSLKVWTIVLFAIFLPANATMLIKTLNEKYYAHKLTFKDWNYEQF